MLAKGDACKRIATPGELGSFQHGGASFQKLFGLVFFFFFSFKPPCLVTASNAPAVFCLVFRRGARFYPEHPPERCTPRSQIWESVRESFLGQSQVPSGESQVRFWRNSGFLSLPWFTSADIADVFEVIIESTWSWAEGRG